MLRGTITGNKGKSSNENKDNKVNKTIKGKINQVKEPKIIKVDRVSLNLNAIKEVVETQKSKENSAIEEKISRNIIAPAHSSRDAQPLKVSRNLDTKESCLETLNEIFEDIENFIREENLSNSTRPAISSPKEKELNIAVDLPPIAEVHHSAPPDDVLIQMGPKLPEEVPEQRPANLFQHLGPNFPIVRLPKRFANHRFVTAKIPIGPMVEIPIGIDRYRFNFERKRWGLRLDRRTGFIRHTGKPHKVSGTFC